MYKIPDKFAIIKHPQMAATIVRKLRWKGNLYCPYCGCVNDIMKHSKAKSGIYRYFCKNCEKTFSDTNGTVFDKSKVPLWKWIHVIITLFEATGSVSAAEVSRSIKVSYKTAWIMMRKVRKSLELDRYTICLRGLIESDQGYFSHKDNQQLIQGIVERGGKISFYPLKDMTEVSVSFPHFKYVEKGSFLCTDSHTSHSILGFDFNHHRVNHSIGEFAWRDVHTNTIEGAWGMLKGILRTIHHGVSKKHLLSYCNLFAFMYSHRKLDLNEKLNLFLQKLCQPRYCTY